MASDVNEVACHVLGCSDALTDDDLMGMISSDAEKLEGDRTVQGGIRASV